MRILCVFLFALAGCSVPIVNPEADEDSLPSRSRVFTVVDHNTDQDLIKATLVQQGTAINMSATNVSMETITLSFVVNAECYDSTDGWNSNSIDFFNVASGQTLDMGVIANTDIDLYDVRVSYTLEYVSYGEMVANN